MTNVNITSYFPKFQTIDSCFQSYMYANYVLEKLLHFKQFLCFFHAQQSPHMHYNLMTNTKV